MKKIFTFLLLSFLCITGFYAQTLTSFQSNGKYGYKNGDQEVILPRYSKVFEFNNHTAWVNLNNEWLLIDEKENRISRSTYDDLIVIQVAIYTHNGVQFTELLNLKYPTTYSMDTIYDYGTLIQDPEKFDLYTPQGNLITDSTFSQVFSPLNVDYFEPKIGDFYVEINSDGTVLFSDYVSYTNTGWSVLWYKYDMSADLREQEMGFTAPLIASFSNVEIPSYPVLTPDPEMGEYGEWYYTDQPSRRGELLVWDTVNGKYECQLYNLRYNKMMTEKSKVKLFLDNVIEDEYVTEPIFVIGNGQDSLNFWMNSRGPISTFPYDFIRAEDNNSVLCEKLETEPEIYDVANDEMVKTPLGSRAVNNSKMMIQLIVSYEDESGETYNETVPQFYSTFYFIRMDNSKVRVMNSDFYVYPSDFDTVFQLETDLYEPIVYYIDKGKFGALDLTTQRTTGAIFDSLIVFSYNDERRDFLSVSKEELPPFYYTISGQKLYTKSNAYELYKAKSGIGVRVYPDLPSEDENEVKLVIQPIYKGLNFSEKADWFEAKNAKGKWGVVSVFGDTIIPFINDKLSYREWSFRDQEARFGYQMNSKGMIGYLDFYLEKAIPCKFKELTELHTFGDLSIGIQTYTETKTGLYSPNLNEILPAEFDAIFPFVIGEDHFMLFKKNGKYKVLSVNEVDLKLAKSIENSRSYDYVLDTIGLVVVSSGFDCYDLKSSTFIKHMENFEDYTQVNLGYVFFMLKGKLGIRDVETGKLLYKPSLTDVMFLDGSFLLTTENGMTYYGDIYSKKKFKMSNW